MERHKNILVKNSLIKSEEAYNDAKFNFENKRYSVTLNRIYYSIFYAVSALAYNFNFITSKHSQLMGWFKRKFIFEDKLFDERLMDIYKTAFKNRQESDYDLLDVEHANLEDIKIALEDAKYFFDTINNFLEKN